MSFFGFDTSGHNKGAPGFSQGQDPFASLSGQGQAIDDALDFEETYDGLGDQLQETGDDLNDDTFGGGSMPTTSRQGGGKDFDFFGQTAKVADAIEEEHLRFNLQPPAARAPAPQQQYAAPQHDPYYAMQHPVRTGYEKYQSDEPVPELNVDQSIWGIAPPKTTVPTQPAQASRKMMSLEEVEAAMRSQPAAASSQAPEAVYPQQTEYNAPLQQQQQQYQQPGQPTQILQRPQQVPLPNFPGPHGQPQQAQQQMPPQPTQILQNPNRAPVETQGTPMGHRSQGSLSHLQSHPHLAGMSEEEKAAFLDQEAKRAKRNHKIWLLSKDNGVMTPQDKNFITRIQLQQLVSATGNPAERGADDSIAEDFYYQVFSHIRAGQRQNPSQPLSTFAQTYLFQTGSRHHNRRHGRPAENHMQRMEQQVQRAVEAAKNKPKNPQLVIAGSLGKISFSNAKTPKPLLNIKRAESETPKPTSGKKSPANANGIDRRTILRNVERVYDTLMKIEDHVRQIPPPPNPADPELEERHREWGAMLEALNAKLWDELKVHEPIGATVPHPFIAFLSCAKGKKAIPRIFPHLSYEQRTTILTMIVYHLDQLDVVQGAAVSGDGSNLNASMRENIELFISTVMPSLMQYLNDTGIDIVDGLLHLIATKLNIDYICRTRIGVSMLTLILSRTVLLKQTGAGSPEQWEKWDQTFETLFAHVEPSLPYMFPGSVNAGIDVYVWQFLAAMGVSANHDQQTRLVLAVKDRVLETVTLSKTLPGAMATERLGSVNLFMRAIGLDVELLQ